MMQLDVINLLLSLPKVDYSPLGISQIQSVMEKRLRLEENEGMLLAGSSKVTPKVYEDTTQGERAAGLINAMKFSTLLVVSVDKINIVGVMNI